MTDFVATGRLAAWDAEKPDLREWGDAEILDGLRQLGIQTDAAAFAKAADGLTMQSDLEDDWLQLLPHADENLSIFTWMSVQELWERWRVPSWPKDRLARMFAYLVDADYAVEWADRFHAPTADEVFDALDIYLAPADRGLPALEEMVELLGMPSAAWPSKMLDAMAEWAEVGNFTLAGRGGAFMARVLGRGHEQGYLAAALISARMFDRAQNAALEVPFDAPLATGFDEMIGYLCLSAGDAVLADNWITRADAASNLRKSEMTFAAEAIRAFLDEWRKGGRDDEKKVPDAIRGASKQAAAQSCYFAFMAFAGTGQQGGASAPTT